MRYHCNSRNSYVARCMLSSLSPSASLALYNQLNPPLLWNSKSNGLGFGGGGGQTGVSHHQHLLSLRVTHRGWVGRGIADTKARSIPCRVPTCCRMRSRSSSVVVEASSSKVESTVNGARLNNNDAVHEVSERRSRRQSMPNCSKSSGALEPSSTSTAPFTHIRSFDEVRRKFGGRGESYEVQQQDASVSVPGKPSTHQPRRSNVYRMKIVTLGERCTGKSCILKRFCENVYVGHASLAGAGGLGRRKSLATTSTRSQRSSGAGAGYLETIGVDYGVKDVGVPKTDKFVRINMYDLAGGREYYEIRREFYDDAQGLLLCYDPRRRETFERLEQWLLEVDTNLSSAGSDGLGSSAPGVVCATKVCLLPTLPSCHSPPSSVHLHGSCCIVSFS